MENFHPERKSEQHQNGHVNSHLSGNHDLPHTSGNHGLPHTSGNHSLSHKSGNHDEINRSGDPGRNKVWSVPAEGNPQSFGAEKSAVKFPHNDNNLPQHHSDTEPQGLTTSSRVRDPLQSHIDRQQQSKARQAGQQDQAAPAVVAVTSSLPRRNIINHIAEFRSFLSLSPSTPPPALKFEEEVISSPPSPSPSPPFYSSTQSAEVIQTFFLQAILYFSRVSHQ